MIQLENSYLNFSCIVGLVVENIFNIDWNEAQLLKATYQWKTKQQIN
jgi:hypothetical protein